jgi:hypothetical protein
MADFKETGGLSIHPNGSDSIATPDSVRSHADAERVAFLSSFSPEEDKAIRRKVDWRFLWLIGLMYIIKNVRCAIGENFNIRLIATDRLHQCCERQSPSSRQAYEYLEAA